MNSISKICSRIDLIRKQKNWTQDQLAGALQLSQPAVSKYLKERVPPAETLLKLAQIGNTTMEWILTGQRNYSNHSETLSVSDPTVSYDAELNLAKKISGLPPDIRDAIIGLIDAIGIQGT